MVDWVELAVMVFHLIKIDFEYAIQLFNEFPKRDMTNVLMGFCYLLGF